MILILGAPSQASSLAVSLPPTPPCPGNRTRLTCLVLEVTVDEQSEAEAQLMLLQLAQLGISPLVIL